MEIEAQNLRLYDRNLCLKIPEWKTADWSPEQAQKGGFRFFMEKEIHEQPEAFRKTMLPRIREGIPVLDGDGIPAGFWKHLKKLRIAACGTAYYCGMMGKMLLEKLAGLPVEVEIASELRYREPVFGEKEAAVVISQSGETADTIAAMRLMREQGVPVVAVVNTPGSSITREADYTVLTHAGPEIAVASTKAYTVQLGVFYLFAIRAAWERGRIDKKEAVTFTQELLGMAEKMEETLQMEDQVRQFAQTLSDTQDLFYIGRGLDYAMALEGALKLKEISYIHAEAYAAGELKHGTLALVTSETPVVALITQPELAAKTLSNLKDK